MRELLAHGQVHIRSVMEPNPSQQGGKPEGHLSHLGHPVGRVTPCAVEAEKRVSLSGFRAISGAHGVTRPTCDAL